MNTDAKILKEYVMNNDIENTTCTSKSDEAIINQTEWRSGKHIKTKEQKREGIR